MPSSILVGLAPHSFHLSIASLNILTSDSLCGPRCRSHHGSQRDGRDGEFSRWRARGGSEQVGRATRQGSR